MLSVKKIKIMFKLAEYENGVGNNDINNGQYYKSDYVRYNILKSIIHVTIAYALILLMVGIYKVEYLISKAVVLDYTAIGLVVFSVYILLIIIYTFTTLSIYSLRYDKSRIRLQRYYSYLRLLRKYYQDSIE